MLPHLDRHQRDQAALAIQQKLVDVDDSLLVEDVQKLSTHFDVFGNARGREGALRDLVSADAEVQLVPRVWGVAGSAEPASALRQIGESAKNAPHWRVELERERERTMRRAFLVDVANTGRTRHVCSLCSAISGGTHRFILPSAHL